MQIYLAPLEGITTYTYRRAYEQHFGGVERYFTPFIVNKKLGSREIQGLLPENNPNMNVIPQIMTNRAEDFLQVTKEIASYGYDTVNLNLGCPSGTVVSKKRGAGFLAYPKELDAFLAEIYEKSEVKISIKTRIGLEEEEEWETLLSIYEKYPMEELIIHPRLRTDYYKAPIRLDAFTKAMEQINVPICYNGELNSVEDIQKITEQFPQIERIMIGRGILRYPYLIEQIRNTLQEKSADLSEAKVKQDIRAFHDRLVADYSKIMSGDRNTLFKMKEIWTYLGESFEGADKYLKKIKKANNLTDYQIAVNYLFSLNLKAF